MILQKYSPRLQKYASRHQKHHLRHKSSLALLLSGVCLCAHADKEDAVHFEVNGVGFDMIFVDGGTFTMGATLEQAFPLDNERPIHEVKLSDFYIGETEVTQELWNAVTGCPFSRFAGDPRLPVESISWEEAMAFVKILQKKTGAEFCLPTEAQWEYAARGGKSSQGYQFAGSDEASEVAWYGANLRPEENVCPDSIALGVYVNHDIAHPFPVAQKMPNELGIYDMSGNVAEWTADYYAPYTEGRKKNPKGPSKGTERVFRGGCWYFGEWACRVAQRQGALPQSRYCNLGFRLAMPKYYMM